MKIAVYAIAKDERKHVERWYASMKEADGVFVLDTGSTDGTADTLRSLGAVCKTDKIDPWNFAVARNASMALVPEEYDILVCTDLDEVFTEGWASKVREAMESHPDANSAICHFATAFNPDGSEKDSMHYWKIHRRSAGAYWKARVHEYLVFPNGKTDTFIEGIRLEHHPDPNKSRDQYLQLLKEEYEQVHDPRSVHYYGRELYFKGMYDEAVFVLLEHLSMEGSDWRDERAWSMRYIARCAYVLNGANLAYGWFWKSAAEGGWMREPLCDMAEIAYNEKDYRLCEMACLSALARTNRHCDYFTEEDAWGIKPIRLLSDALVAMGRYADAFPYCRDALLMNPEDDGIVKNYAFIKRKMNENKPRSYRAEL